jgi:hypothetical protein
VVLSEESWERKRGAPENVRLPHLFFLDLVSASSTPPHALPLHYQLPYPAMPSSSRSKRNKVVHLSQTDRKTKAQKGELITTIREHADQFAFLWVFDVEHMRNTILQEVRTAWKGSR